MIQTLVMAYQAFSTFSDEADKTQGRLNELSNTFKEYQRSVTSVDEAISDVARKSKYLNSDQQALNQTTESLAGRFVNLGKYIGRTAESAQDLINRLRELKGLAIERQLALLNRMVAESENNTGIRIQEAGALSGRQKAVSTFDRLGLNDYQGVYRDLASIPGAQDLINRAFAFQADDSRGSARDLDTVARDNTVGNALIGELKALEQTLRDDGNEFAVSRISRLGETLNGIVEKLQEVEGSLKTQAEIQNNIKLNSLRSSDDYKAIEERLTTAETFFTSFKARVASAGSAEASYRALNSTSPKTLNIRDLLAELEKEIDQLGDNEVTQEYRNSLAELRSGLSALAQETLDAYVDSTNRVLKLEKDATSRKLSEIKSRVTRNTSANDILAFRDEAVSLLNTEWQRARHVMEKELNAKAGVNADSVAKREIENSLANLDASYAAKIQQISNEFQELFDRTRGTSENIKDELKLFQERIKLVDREFKTDNFPTGQAVKSKKADIAAAENDLNRGTVTSAQVYRMNKELYDLETAHLLKMKEAMAGRL